ncbi:MAG: DNA-binding protein WhiA [Oscillospiraceae bacterium]|nr:DNA-binding protein WhiA [Oscillospiraceae bacterium]
MSFTTDVKRELCDGDLSRRQEKTVLYGFLYCLREQNAYFTEIPEVKDFLRRIAGEAKVPSTNRQRLGKSGFMLDFAALAYNASNFSVDSSYVDGRDENTGLFLRGAFLACGIVSDPNKEYHLEFSVGSSEKASELRRLITESGMNIKSSTRKGKALLYTKDSESISDILTFTGAMISSMEIMNAKIYKDLRNNVNRKVNCESANIEKTVSASRKQLDDIEYIEKSAGLGILAEELRTFAEIRRENIDLSLSEIGKMLGISRSGVYHRIKRISETADRLRERGE